MQTSTTSDRAEAQIFAESNVLLALSSAQPNAFRQDFWGTIVSGHDLSTRAVDFGGKTVYLCGELSRASHFDLSSAKRVFILRELSSQGESADKNWTFVDSGRVPVGVHGVGVNFRRFFDPSLAYFKRISDEHAFQSLTESTKPATSHRKGIYLTPVEQDDAGLHFRLLRCSTNLAGPTENFRETDRRIVDALNEEADFLFRHHASLNHVLAQVYHNSPAAEGIKPFKAKISAHADKTKDMPANGIMAFCTFYDRVEHLAPLANDPFDLGHKGISGLAKLRFRLKDGVAASASGPLPAEFVLTLYPNSAFFMPLSTNRAYTHEIVPSTLDPKLLPTRLGYVVRCSKTKAIHKDGRTLLKLDGNLVDLEQPTPEGMAELRQLYAEENHSQEFVEYGDRFRFSMNTGDYLAPRI